MRKLYFLLVLAISFANAQELALVRKDGLFGYIDKSGNFAIQPKFKKAKSFSDGLALAEENGKWGYIDKKGNWAIQPTFAGAADFNSGYAVVKADKKGAESYINKKGETVKGATSDKIFDFVDGIAMIKTGDKVGFMNAQMKVVVEPKYQIIKEFVGNYARVKNNDRWGIIDKTGKVIIDPTYDDIGDYSKGVAWAKNGDNFGLIINGKFTALEGTQKIWDFRDGNDLTYAKKGDKVGFIDRTGKWVIEPKFDKARAFSKGLAPVNVGKAWGYINTKGTFVVDAKYKDAEVFSEGLAPVKEENWGFINESGKVVIPTQYGLPIGGLIGMISSIKEDQTGFSGGLARVKNEKKWGFLKPDGTVLGNQWFENAELFSN